MATTTTEQKPYIVNGVEMPFTKEELTKLLSIIKKVMANTCENASSSEEKENLDDLLNQIK